MATNGALNTTAWQGNYGNRYLEFAWERTAINVTNQTSTISWTLTGKGTYTGYVASAPFTVVIDGETVYTSATRIQLYPDQLVASGTKVIQHNTDGTKTFSVSVKAAIYWSEYNVSGSANFALDLVGMATITAAPNFNDEANPTIEYYNPVGNNLTLLEAAISLTGETPDITYREISKTGASYTFTLTDAERKVLRAATQGSNSRKVRFYLRNTVNGERLFAWKEVTYTVVNANPIVSGSVVDTNATTKALTGDSSTIIRYHSTAYASFTATPQKEATIKTQNIEHNGGLSSGNTKTVTNVESNVFTYIAADSRGNTGSKTIVAQMIDYIKPTVNIDTSAQMDTSGNYAIRCTGNYYNDTFGYTSAAAANTLTVKYRYKTQGGSFGSWYTMTATISGNTYTATANISGLDYRTTYVLQCQIIDKLNTVTTAETPIRSLPVFHWSETDFTFEVPVNFNAGVNGATATVDDSGIDNGVLDGDLQITGNLRLKGSGNYGNTLYFGDGTYCYITETTDDDLTIKATDINLNGNVYVNGAAIGSSGGASATAGTWTPTLTTAAAVSSYSVRQGWYQKVGNVVTIGWQIKADINTGYSSTAVAISGVPFTPSYAAFGGGIAHNVYLTGGFCFEGWSVGTNGQITMRGQPCNNTAAGNLQINSTAYYPTGNSTTTITLAGTICYTV